MSSRVLKKLHGGTLDLPTNGIDEDFLTEDDDDINGTHVRGNHLNPFDLLNQQSFSESEVKEDDNETEHASAATNVAAGASASKKKKKKRKKKVKNTGNYISSEDNERSVKESMFKSESDANAQGEKVGATRFEFDKSLFVVELKNLNPQNEMRRTFGKRVVKIENKRGRQKVTLKSTYLVSTKDSWPPITKNIINMKSTSGPDCATTSNSPTHLKKTQWFAFEHSQYYQGIQNLFLAAVERTDSDFLISLIRRCPYHVDSLVQLSELCKMTEDFALAAELIERALFVLEMSLHPSFSFTSGNCRLDYSRQENRSFFIVLFKHAQYLEGRACCRTAFEISKLILSLSPDMDPLAIILIIDYYALRSKQYTWFIKFYEEYDVVRNLSQLPNMAYSYALSLYCLHGATEQANKALQYAFLMFPGVLRPLLEELSIQVDPQVVSNPYFNTEISTSQTPALHQLVCLYVCRGKVIWRHNNIGQWLEPNIQEVLSTINRNDSTISEYNQKRASRYGTPPRAILRHVFLCDYKEKVPLAPFLSKEKEPILMYDPLPPLNSVNFYDRKSSSSSPTSAANRSVSMFFQSIMPSFNINTGQDQPAAQDGVAADFEAPNANRDNEIAAVNDEVDQVDRQLQMLNMGLQNNPDEGAVASYRELTQSLTNIVDAMRDFLHNFRLTDNLANSDAEANGGSTEEDTSDYTD